MNKKNLGKIDKKNIKRLISALIISFILLLALILRISFLQFVEGSSLKEMASSQQTSTKTIEPARGTIFDTNGKVLAVSAEVDTVSINTSKVKYSNKSEVDKDFLARSFSTIFELDYDETLEKITSGSPYITIASKVEADKIALLKEWMEENKIYSGINIDSSTKRYYPYKSLASNLIRFYWY